MMAVAKNAQTDAELAHMEVVFSFTEVAGVLKGQRFAAGARNLFDTFATKGSDGVARVGSNGFLRLAMQSKLAPKYMSNMDVLRCVEVCLDRGSMERAHHSGLLFDTFVECLGRLAMIAFSGLTPEQTAELIMLQLDQETRCLTSTGSIQKTPVILSPRARAIIARSQQSANVELPLSDEPTASESQDIPVPRMPPPPPPADEASDDGLQQGYSFATCSSGMVSSTISLFSSIAKEQVSQEENSDKYASPSHTAAQNLSHRAEAAPRPRQASRTSRPSGRMAKFLARMEQDKLERERKLVQMRRAAAPRQVSAQTDATSASEQAEIATRLHESRKKHFDKRRDKYQAMGLVDEKTGQAFFKPRLVSKPPVRGGVASTPFVVADHMNEKDEAIHRFHRNSIGDECDSEQGEWRNRFEKLHAEATSQQARKAARERATVIAHKRLAAAPKASNRTKRVFARKLTLELRDAFVKSCIAAGNDRGDTLSRAQTKSLLESLIGLVPAAQQRTKADQDLIESVLGIISNGGGAKEIDEPSFTQFARAVASHDPVATRSLKRLDPAEEVLRDFRLRLMAQRKFAQALRQKANAEAAAAVRPSFAPSLCPHSRELDDRRKSRDAAALTREQDLLQRTDKVQRAIEEKRKASLASAAEDKECTFRPKISPHNPHYPVPLPRAHRLCQRQHHHHPHHHHEDSDETEEDDVESKTESDFDRRSIRSRTSGASRRPVDKKGLASQQMARPFTYSSMAAERQKKYNKPHGVAAAKPQEASFKQENSHALATNDDEEKSTEETETMSVCSAQSGESDELLFYADVQVRKHVHRIPVYENDDLRKVAARFSALHGLNVRVEQALFTHLTSLIESFP